MAGLHGSPLALTPSSDLSATLRSENRLLKSRLRQVQTDLQTEHGDLQNTYLTGFKLCWEPRMARDKEANGLLSVLL